MEEPVTTESGKSTQKKESSTASTIGIVIAVILIIVGFGMAYDVTKEAGRIGSIYSRYAPGMSDLEIKTYLASSFITVGTGLCLLVRSFCFPGFGFVRGMLTCVGAQTILYSLFIILLTLVYGGGHFETIGIHSIICLIGFLLLYNGFMPKIGFAASFRTRKSKPPEKSEE